MTYKDPEKKSQEEKDLEKQIEQEKQQHGVRVRIQRSRTTIGKSKGRRLSAPEVDFLNGEIG